MDSGTLTVESGVPRRIVAASRDTVRRRIVAWAMRKTARSARGQRKIGAPWHPDIYHQGEERPMHDDQQESTTQEDKIKEPLYKGASMHVFGWMFLIVFGIGALWDLTHGSPPGPIATAGILLGVFWTLRGRWWLRKKIIDEDAIKRHEEVAARKVEKTQKRQQREAAARERAEAEQIKRDQEGYSDAEKWYPPKPFGTLVAPWAKGKPLEVAGERYQPRAFVTLLGSKPGFNQYEGVEIRGDAILVPDPNNPYGKGRAVAVYFRGEHVGYLAQMDADRYFPVLAEMRHGRTLAQVDARVWASQPGGRGRGVNARVTLWLPEPSGMVPSNKLPEQEHVVIPSGRTIQVTKEDEHMDVLVNYVRRGSGVDNYVAATLRSINEIRPRSSYEAVQVEIDGQRVGVLTKGQSEKLLPLVRHIEQRGLIPVVRATVKGTRLKADVILNCADAQTIDDDWLDDLGDGVAEANVDRMPVVAPHPDFGWDDED